MEFIATDADSVRVKFHFFIESQINQSIINFVTKRSLRIELFDTGVSKCDRKIISSNRDDEQHHFYVTFS